MSNTETLSYSITCMEVKNFQYLRVNTLPSRPKPNCLKCFSREYIAGLVVYNASDNLFFRSAGTEGIK